MKLRMFRTWRRCTREVRPMLALALPIVTGLVGQVLIGLIDTIMVGRVGVVPLAASSFVNAVAHVPLVFSLGLLTSMSVLTSQAFGSKQAAEAGEVLRHGLVIATGTGVLSVIGLVCLRPFLDRFGQPPEILAAAGSYLILFGSSLLPALVAQACKQFSEALNRPWVPMFILLGGVLLNVGLNWILIYGHWGAPALGLEGAGWATLIARMVMALALVAYVVRAPALREFQPRRWRARFCRERFKRLLTLGGPVAAQHLLEVGAFVFAALMMGWISAVAIASHQIAITCAATTFMFALGLGMAVSIRVGQAWGAGQYARMRRIGFVGISVAAGVMGCFAVMFVIAGEPMARLFVSSPAVVALTSQLLLVTAVFQVADGIQISAISALRGLNDVRVPALIAMLAYWILAVPLGCALAFAARYGAVGIWIGLAAGLAVAAICLLWRFHWKTRELQCDANSAATKSVSG